MKRYTYYPHPNITMDYTYGLYKLTIAMGYTALNYGEGYNSNSNKWFPTFSYPLSVLSCLASHTLNAR